MELQFSHGLGVYSLRSRLLLYVESIDPAGWIHLIWHVVAALAQSAAIAAGSIIQIRLEDDSICHHPGRLISYVNEVV